MKKNKFKVGDRVICKLARRSIFHKIKFEIDKIYIITEIDPQFVLVNDIAFMIITKPDFYSFDEHFLTMKEFQENRKLKLIKINKN